MRKLLTTGLALALAGCGGEEVVNNSVAPTPTPTPPMLGGVDLNTPLRAAGTGPYWQIEIAPGTIDSDYRGELSCIARFVGGYRGAVAVRRGERICQLVILERGYDTSIQFDDALSATDRGEKGFGSTGT